MADTGSKILASVGGLLFAGSGALLAGRAIQAEPDAGKRQLMSAGVIFGIVIVLRIVSAAVFGYGVPKVGPSRAAAAAGPATRRRRRAA